MVTVSPNGKWISVSFTTNMGRGTGSGKTYVLRTRDKRILFDHPASADTAFIGDEFFAYGEYSYPKHTHQTHVLKLPQD